MAVRRGRVCCRVHARRPSHVRCPDTRRRWGRPAPLRGLYGPAQFIAEIPADRTDFTDAALWLTLTTAGGIAFYTGKLPLDGSSVIEPVDADVLTGTEIRIEPSAEPDVTIAGSEVVGQPLAEAAGPTRLIRPWPAVFVVRILRPEGWPAGTGVLVGRREVMTCAHVVNRALGRDLRSQDRPEGTVVIDFPLVDAGSARCEARVTRWLPPPRDRAAGDAPGLLGGDGRSGARGGRARAAGYLRGRGGSAGGRIRLSGCPAAAGRGLGRGRGARRGGRRADLIWTARRARRCGSSPATAVGRCATATPAASWAWCRPRRVRSPVTVTATRSARTGWCSAWPEILGVSVRPGCQHGPAPLGGGADRAACVGPAVRGQSPVRRERADPGGPGA